MLRIAVLLFVAAVLQSACADLYSDCGSTLANIEKVAITDCDGSDDECVLKRNTNVTIAVDFTTKDAVSKISTVVHGIIKGIPVPFPLGQPDACKESGLTCPLAPNSHQEYRANMNVLKAYPRVSVDVKWQLLDADGNDVICILIPAKIE